DQRFKGAVRIEGNALDLVPLQRFRQRVFTNLLGVDHGGEGDIRNDSLMLGAATGNPIELRLGNLQLAVHQVTHRLNGTLTEGLVTENQAAAVILNGTGKDF